MKQRVKGPLRKIIREIVDDYGGRHEVLECGHTLRRRVDMIGETNAVRRRCWKCAKGEAAPPQGGAAPKEGPHGT